MNPVTGALVGVVADRYEIENEIGRGGTAVVYRARDRVRQTTVAVKVLRLEAVGSLSVDRFLREIRTTAQLPHPHIVPVLDSGEFNERPFFVLPYMEGGTLRQRLVRDKQLQLEEVVKLGVTLCKALGFAHQSGLIHRDVKPENILFSGNVPCLADFGTARALETASDELSTTTGIVRGTAAYMSPEQASGERQYDGRSDIYSLACVLYEAIAGIQPFVGPTAQAVISQRLTHPPRPVSIYRPTVPPELEEVLTRATAVSPADRYQTVGDFERALEGTLPTLTRAVHRGRRRARLSPLAMTLAGVAVVALAALGGWRYFHTAVPANSWIVVADFDSPPADAQLAATVRDLSAAALRQSSFVQVVDRRQLNEMMRRASIPETLPVTATRARELAQRGSVAAILEGGIRRVDSSRYELDMHVVRAADGTSLASVAANASRGDLTATVQRLVDELRSRVGERNAAVASTRPLRDVATPSFEAFSNYSRAIDLVVQRGDYVGSNQLIRQALATDTAFAAAWGALGTNYLTMHLMDSARLAMRTALAFPNRLTAAETYRIKAEIAYALDRNIPDAIRWYDLYLTELPQSSGGHSNRGLLKSALGQYEEALPDLRAAAVSPFGAATVQAQLLNLAGDLVIVGQLDEARRVADSLAGQPAQYVRVMLPVAEGRWKDAELAAADALTGAPTPGPYRMNAVVSYASALAAEGQAPRADSVLAAAANELKRGSMARWYSRARIELALAVGQRPPVAASLIPADTTPAAAMLRALAAGAAGDSAAAHKFVPNLSALAAAPAATSPQLVLAWIDINGKRYQAALDRLGAAALAGEHDPLTLDRPDSYLLRWTVATAYERQGRTDSAVVYYRLASTATRIPPTHLALRGFLAPAAERRLAQLEHRSP